MINHIVLTLIALLIAAGSLWVGARITLRRIRFVKRGWMVTSNSSYPDWCAYAYVERNKGQIDFYAEIMWSERGEIGRVVYLPGAGDWNERVPTWAHDRRDEIVRRIKQVLPKVETEYRSME